MKKSYHSKTVPTEEAPITSRVFCRLSDSRAAAAVAMPPLPRFSHPKRGRAARASGSDAEMLEHLREQGLGGAFGGALLVAEGAVEGQAGEAVDDRPGGDRRRYLGRLARPRRPAAGGAVEDRICPGRRRAIVGIVAVEHMVAPHQV